MSPCTKEYVDRLEKCNAAGIVAHSYTRYMGDLSGGQILLKKAQKAFGLDNGCTDGLSFYVFANIPKGKQFKERYRAELDGLKPDKKLADEIVAEANIAFLVNMRLFAELDVMAVRASCYIAAMRASSTGRIPLGNTHYRRAFVRVPEQ